MALNIFEPRYRLMVRRCMEGSRRFGMATVNSSHQLQPVRALLVHCAAMLWVGLCCSADGQEGLLRQWQSVRLGLPLYLVL